MVVIIKDLTSFRQTCQDFKKQIPSGEADYSPTKNTEDPALLIQQEAAFSNLGELIMSVIIGATIIHEFIEPITSKIALKKAKEIS